MGPPPIWHGPPSRLLLGLLLQLLAITATAWIGARIVAQPIRRLAEGATELGRNIDALPIDEHGPEETRIAAREFNRMQAQIRNQLDERARFLAAVSHDLRTPLTRLRLRLNQIPGDSKLQTKMEEDIAEMSTMLDATLSYLRGASVQEPWQSFDIQALLESLAEDAQERGEAVSVNGGAQPIQAQPLLLRRCISNLIDNALQYGSSAELHLEQSDNNVTIEVRDHGPGIPENRMSAVFEPFYRLESSRNRRTGGCGLGLAIARDAARRHGGDITLRNASDGGLVARVTLPRLHATR